MALAAFAAGIAAVPISAYNTVSAAVVAPDVIDDMKIRMTLAVIVVGVVAAALIRIFEI
jgi:hypothetical protein